ncbi:MAG: hypothetical protein IIB39_03900 [Candidatus Marinimicrobia bacterium]|nr:hypothetical protein [Candidatus Neomarinimicrobiota bacterium]
MQSRSRTFKNKFIGLTVIVIVGFISGACGSATLLLENSSITFDKEEYSKSANYIASVEGVLVDSKGKYVNGAVLEAASKDYENITSTEGITGVDGKFKVNLYWINQPFIYAEVFPNPAQSSLTTSGFSYIKDARTITLDIPVFVKGETEELASSPITLYSLASALKRMANDVVNSRLTTFSFTAEDYETGLTINGATFTLRATSSIVSSDSLLKSYIVSDTLRAIALKSVNPFVIDKETLKLKPGNPVKFPVINFSEYTITFEHPQYHTVVENLYAEKPIAKIFRVGKLSEVYKYDFLDQ